MSDTTETPAVHGTVATLAGIAGERFGELVAASHKVDGEWREMSFAQVSTTVDEIALGLVALGIEPGDRVAILADTRVEWTLASYGISAAGAIVVPVYPTNSPMECAWVLSNSGARAVVCETAEQLAKIDRVREESPDLNTTIGIEPDAGETTLEALRDQGRGGDHSELERRQSAVNRGDIYTIIYTSGTTGNPKGVVLTHGNAMSVGEMVAELDFISTGERTYLFLPLAHAFALTTQLASFELGTTIIYYGGDTKRVIEELVETHPTYLPSAPRIFEKLYTAAMKLQEQASEQDQARFREAVTLGIEVHQRRQRGDDVPEQMRAAFDAADERLFSRVRGPFGGEIRQAVSGAAPIAAEILEFFYACGVPVLEGWGMTETTAVGTVGTLEHFKFGTVGRPMPGLEAKIAESDGEILLTGPNIFREYWDNPEATAQTLVDGWLHTGDVGEIDDEGYLKITGRKKDIIITAGGKNLSPANLENDLKQSRFISQAVMYGDRRPYPVALITLDPEEIVPWAKEHGLPEDVGELADSDEVRELVQAELDRANEHFAQVEQIKKFTILDRDLSIEDGELTPTLKVKRNIISERYADRFDALYGT
ncbi:MAG: long-chain fatty acid--CoA ligase [Actinomycetota bacterium]|nr:long-chain fatty acid--CoA ligase [Actinomycetota bacterium]